METEEVPLNDYFKYLLSYNHVEIPIATYVKEKEKIESFVESNFKGHNVFKEFTNYVEIYTSLAEFKDFSIEDYMFSIHKKDLIVDLLSHIEGLPQEIIEDTNYRSIYILMLSRECISLLKIINPSGDYSEEDYESINNISGYYLVDRANEIISKFNKDGVRI